MSIKKIILAINNKLEKKEKFLVVSIFILFIVAAFVELITISTLIPFLSVMLDEGITYSNFNFKYLIFSEKIFSNDPFLYITLLFVLIIAIATLLKFLILKSNLIITKALGLKISKIVFTNVIEQSYIEYSRKNSSEYISIIENKVDILVSFIYRFFQTLSSLLIITAVLGTLLIINFKVTITFFIIITCIYFFIYKVFKKKLVKIDKVVAYNLNQRVKIVQETIAIFRQIKLDNLSEYFKKLFETKNTIIREGEQKLAIIGNFPKIIIEGGAIILIALLSYLLVTKNIYEEKYILTIVGTIVFGASRILPLIQNIFYNITYIVGQQKAVMDVIDFFTNNYNLKEIYKKNLEFKNNINFRNVSFGYIQNQNIIEDINLTIKKNLIIGLVGKTGSGKSTFVDLLSGLLIPNSGEITVDNVPITDSFDNWRKKISYIDQKITLIDSTIAENIALGIDKNQIDLKLLEKVLQQSECSEFINNLPDKYLTLVGERGIRLSGGQIQRIGIARALYKNSEILILDEPTSALDLNTENLIMKSIDKLKYTKTIILITHRTSILKSCQEVYSLQNKKINKI
jgi:ABC-type multidrug transport system fused ATPase/permease subunit|tara:strand:- start:936 stop:2654 length:1719 start_codon:yes stop_codon:yes gene_type:complete